MICGMRSLVFLRPNNESWPLSFGWVGTIKTFHLTKLMPWRHLYAIPTGRTFSATNICTRSCQKLSRKFRRVTEFQVLKIFREAIGPFGAFAFGRMCIDPEPSRLF